MDKALCYTKFFVNVCSIMSCKFFVNMCARSRVVNLCCYKMCIRDRYKLSLLYLSTSTTLGHPLVLGVRNCPSDDPLLVNGIGCGKLGETTILNVLTDIWNRENSDKNDCLWETTRTENRVGS